MSKDTLTIGGMLVTGIIGLAGLMLHQSGNISELRTEVRTDIAELRTEVQTDIAELRTELHTDIAELRTELRHEIGGLRIEMRTEIKAQSDQIKALQQRVARIEGLLEGMRPTLANAPAT